MGSFCAISGATELPGPQSLMSSEPMDETYAETDTLSDEPTPQDRAQTSTLAQDEVELFDPGIYAKNHPLGAWFLDRILYIVIAIIGIMPLRVVVNILGMFLHTLFDLKPEHPVMIGHHYAVRGVEVLRILLVVLFALTLAHAFHWFIGLFLGVFMYFIEGLAGGGGAGGSSSSGSSGSPRQESFSGGGGTFGGGGASGSW